MIFIYFDLLFFSYPHWFFAGFVGEMTEVNQAMVRTLNVHRAKSDMVKFDGTNNFNMRRYEMMDVLTASNLEDALPLENKPEENSKKDWDKINQMASAIIISSLT